MRAASGTLPSWRVIFGRELVPVFKSGVNEQGADDNGYFPINAVYLQAPGCRPTGCEDATVFLDDGLARCGTYLNAAFIHAPPGVAVAQQLLDFKIKITAGAIKSTTLVTGSAVIKAGDAPLISASPTAGLLAMVSDVLGTQFEFWARVRQEAGPDAQPVEVRIQMIVDRLSGQMAAFVGEIAGGGDLPIVNVTPP
jgi:hypothetical protein